MSASFTKQSATAVRRRVVRWLWPAALLALTPKCVLCVLAYAGLGSVLGLGGGPELCGAPAVPSETGSRCSRGLASPAESSRSHCSCAAVAGERDTGVAPNGYGQEKSTGISASAKNFS